MVKVSIEGSGNGVFVGVSENGELITRAFDYSEPAFQLIDQSTDAFNFQSPKAGKNFIITGAILSGNKDVGVNGAVTTIYEATSIDSTTVATSRTLLEVEVPKSTVIPLTPLPNIRVEEGFFVNGKVDDISVRVALYGYFVPVI